MAAADGVCKRLFEYKYSILLYRSGGFGARDYRNLGQLRNNRGGGGNRSGSCHQHGWDRSNGGAGGNMWNVDHHSVSAGGYDRLQQQTATGNNNRQADYSWWDSTS